jgi:hypothetical protein
MQFLSGIARFGKLNHHPRRFHVSWIDLESPEDRNSRLLVILLFEQRSPERNDAPVLNAPILPPSAGGKQTKKHDDNGSDGDSFSDEAFWVIFGFVWLAHGVWISFPIGGHKFQRWRLSATSFQPAR